MYVGNFYQSAVSSTAPEYLDVLFYVPGTSADSIWAGNGDGLFTPQAVTINGDYNPIIGNFDANATGTDMTDIFWYGPGTKPDSVWMNNGKTFTSRAATVNGTYSPIVVPSRESTTQDDIFWDSKTAGDFLWVTNGTSTAFSYTSMTPSAWGGTDIGTRDGIAGDFNAADPTASALYYDSISSGGSFSCAMTSSGGVKCWGLNSSGQLGNGTTTNSSIPVNVTSATSNMFSVAAGNAHACAVTTGQAAVCWGYNANGQLGNGTTTNSTTPVAVSSLGTTVSEVSASEFHSCALINGGTVKCWGANQYGQLGNGTTTNSLTPVTVTGLSSVTQIDAGLSSLTCAVSAGAAKCWGLNGSGQLGNGNTTNQSSPVTVTGLGSGVAKVGAGSSHACALTAAGAVKCWGANDSGQLGNGTNTPSTTPVAVTGLTSGVSDLTVGQSTNCATLSTGVVKCWGANTYGQTGTGSVSTGVLTPTTVVGLNGTANSPSAGGNQTCVLMNLGRIQCAGQGTNGNLGDGTTTTSSSFTEVAGGRSFGSFTRPTGNADVLWYTAGDGTGEQELLWYDLDSLS